MVNGRTHHHYGIKHNTPELSGPGQADAVFDLKTGHLYIPDKNGHMSLVVPAASGRNEGYDNADMAGVKNTGPIPPGEYSVSTGQTATLMVNHKKRPTPALRLEPIGETRRYVGKGKQYDRDGLLLHRSFGQSSHGCVVLPPDQVDKVFAERKNGNIRRLYVTRDAANDPALIAQNHFAVAESSHRLAAGGHHVHLALNDAVSRHRHGKHAGSARTILASDTTTAPPPPPPVDTSANFTSDAGNSPPQTSLAPTTTAPSLYSNTPTI